MVECDHHTPPTREASRVNEMLMFGAQYLACSCNVVSPNSSLEVPETRHSKKEKGNQILTTINSKRGESCLANCIVASPESAMRWMKETEKLSRRNRLDFNNSVFILQSNMQLQAFRWQGFVHCSFLSTCVICGTMGWPVKYAIRISQLLDTVQFSTTPFLFPSGHQHTIAWPLAVTLLRDGG